MGVTITLTLTNIFQFVSMISPLFIVFFTILISILNNTLIKGFILNIGVIIVSGIVLLLKNILKSEQSPYASPFCNVLPSPFTVKDGDKIFNNPSTSSAVLSFITAYLVYPMQINNQLNPTILTFLIPLIAINIAVELQHRCTNVAGSLLGILIGGLFGMIYYTVLSLNKNQKDLVYFTKELTNNIQCGKSGPTKFKCTLYKNGVAMN